MISKKMNLSSSFVNFVLAFMYINMNIHNCILLHMYIYIICAITILYKLYKYKKTNEKTNIYC